MGCRGIGVPRGVGGVGGPLEGVNGCRGVSGILGAGRECRYSGPEGV